MKGRYISFMTLLFLLFFHATSLWADPTALLRAMNSEVILNGPQATGMGGASLTMASPAGLPKAPRLIGLDLGMTDFQSSIHNDGTFLSGSLGLVWPIERLKLTIGIRALRFRTDEFEQGENEFLPAGSHIGIAKAQETGLLIAMGREMTEITKRLRLGLAIPLYYKAEFKLKGNNGKRQTYYLNDRFGPGFFLQYDVFPFLTFGTSFFHHTGTQEYAGPDYTGKKRSWHQELRFGLGLRPDSMTTIAVDFERHRTKAPLHKLIGHEVRFDWTWRWYLGAERWFTLFGRPVPNLAIRAGCLDERSPTFGLSLRLKLGERPLQLDYTFVRNHSIMEFEHDEPGMYGARAFSHTLTVSLPF